MTLVSMSKDIIDTHNQIIMWFNMDKKLGDNNGFDGKVYYSGGRLWVDFNLTLSLMTLAKKKLIINYL